MVKNENADIFENADILEQKSEKSDRVTVFKSKILKNGHRVTVGVLNQFKIS